VTEEQQMGDYYNNLHEYDQAIVHYKKMLAASLKLGVYRNLDMEADVCRKMANAHNVQGRYDKALEYIHLALEKDSIQGNTLEIIEDYREAGKIHLYMGDYTAGMEYLKKALSLNEGMDQSLKGINRLSIADTYLTLSRIHTVLGDFSQGELYGLNALSIFKNQDHREGEMESLLQLGKISHQAGSPTTGETFLQSSLKLANQLNKSTYRQKEALALLRVNQAKYEEALRLKLEATEETKQTRNIPQITWALMLTGDLYQTIGDQQKAMEYYQEAIGYLDSTQIIAPSLDASANLRAGDLDQAYSYFSTAGSEVAAGIASLRLGEVAMEWNLWQEAISHFQTSKHHFAEASLSDGEARSDIMLASSYLNMNLLSEARQSLDRANTQAEYDETKWRMLYIRGKLYEKLSQPDSAIAAYSSAVKIIERIRGNLTVEEYKSLYMEDKIEVYDRLIQLLMDQGRSDESFYFSEKARARTFLDMLGNGRIHIRKDESAELVEMEQKLSQEIQSLSRLLQKGELNLTRGIDVQRIEKEIYEKREEYSDLLTQIKLYNPQYNSIMNMEVADIQDLLLKIDQKTAFLVYWVSQENLFIWMITSREIQSKSVKVSEEEIIDLVTNGRKTVGSRKHEEIYNLGYRLLIEPFEKELDAYETIGIIPHLSLHFLPFQCLINESGSYLIDSYNLFYAPSLNSFALSADAKGSPDKQFFALALGNMEFSGLTGLPGTSREISHISTIFAEPTVAFEESSTESYFKSSATPYQYVHLATHGILDQIQPMYSYLVLAPSEQEDGLLTVNEIFGLELNAQLVVLSACETGLGSLNRGDEIIGLSRAFLYAGAESVVVSLWSVADEPTAYLMMQFYTHLTDYDPVESLRFAQIATRQKYEIPFYWAPFQIIGSGL